MGARTRHLSDVAGRFIADDRRQWQLSTPTSQATTSYIRGGALICQPPPVRVCNSAIPGTGETTRRGARLKLENVASGRVSGVGAGSGPVWRAAHRRVIVAALAVAALLAGLATLGAQAAQAETLTAGNGIYSFYVNNENGQYTATTGPSHPLGAGLNILFGDGSPGTSFDTVRSYTSSTNYELPNVTGSTTVPLGTNGFQTTYMLEENGDNLQVVQTLKVNGTTFNDSYAEVTTVVTNKGGTSRKIGVRYLWDYQIGADDGPTFQANEPNGPVLLKEESFPSPSFNHYTIEDNDVNPSPPTFDVLGTVTGPAVASPVAPTLLQNVSWAYSFGTPFEYATAGREVSNANGELNDNAVLYYWGDKESDAPDLAPGGSYRASASMFLTPPGAGLPGTPPVVKITSGPPTETELSTGTFTFKGVTGGTYECSIDGGAFATCTSGQTFGPLLPGDHQFQVRETLAGVTGPPATYRWTIDLPKKCVLRVARARVFVFTKHDKARLVIHYTSYHPAKVSVGYTLSGSKGKLSLGSASAKFKKKGVFRLSEHLTKAEMRKVRAAKSFAVKFRIPKTPHSCGRYYTKRLTIPQRISNQTVWFQSDSRFEP